MAVGAMSTEFCETEYAINDDTTCELVPNPHCDCPRIFYTAADARKLIDARRSYGDQRPYTIVARRVSAWYA